MMIYVMTHHHKEFHSLLSRTPFSVYTEYILGYIGGFIVRKLIRNISCEECVNTLLSNDRSSDYLSLVCLNDNGGLLYPSSDVFKILKISEIAFKTFVCGHGSKP